MKALWSLLVTLFAWPYGIVVGNLLASAIWAIPTFWHLHNKIDRHARNVDRLHQRLDDINQGDK